MLCPFKVIIAVCKSSEQHKMTTSFAAPGLGDVIPVPVSGSQLGPVHD
jgi:hypothetical protein